MFLSWKLHGIISYHQILTRKHFPIVWNLLLEKIWRKTWILPWSLHFMQNLFFGLWSKFKSWLRLLCVNIDYTLWIQLDTQIFNAKINDFKCLKYNWGYVLWGGKLLTVMSIYLCILDIHKVLEKSVLRQNPGVYSRMSIAHQPGCRPKRLWLSIGMVLLYQILFYGVAWDYKGNHKSK